MSSTQKAPETIGERLRLARELSDLPAYKLSELAGLSKNLVQMIESGARDNPESETVISLARVLGVSCDWLLLGEGKPPRASSVQAAVEAARGQSSPQA